VADRKHHPLVAGLTGSIGMGKSETAKLFAKLGVPVHDADATVHVLYGKGGAAVAPIEAAFPGTTSEDHVDRSKLMQRLSGDEAAFKRLESIVHPLVLASRREFLAAAAKRRAAFVVLDIPLLFETGGEKDVDAIIVVSAPPEMQRERVLRRPGMTLEKWEAIRARQVPDSEKRAKADFVIETDKGLEHAFESVKRVASELKRRAQERLKTPHA
jgi:dephospho-CoA kinase